MFLVAPAHADESPFGSIYTTDTQPMGAFELEQWARFAWQKPDERFRAFEGRTELEYGITDHFMLSLYANYSSSKVVPHNPGAPDDATDETKFDGFSAEAIYQVLDPYRNSIGLAFYLEPSFGSDERELEGKILLQKNFLDDQLIFAVNINLEYVWEREDHHWEKGSALEFFGGASYRFAPGWSAGLELLNENEFEGQLIFANNHHVATAFYTGPALHYSAEGWWATVEYLRQLPWADGAAGEIRDGLVIGAERNRLLFRFGLEL